MADTTELPIDEYGPAQENGKIFRPTKSRHDAKHQPMTDKPATTYVVSVFRDLAF
ncbi:hypothetical protein LHFGNBLO_003486 [Mesorhizobium sp. AR10]|uniref:hypothetical protein n=1 Tax=Mesorhizobium sp. AR10 TaxID=2865839 RepID=UPI00215E6D07|nr:hypothetical protein [Mesorhizobium sp. AR10]UVK36555.1 hypothetical protein LHFGNBLO_003486 [Mesorhizobium sp. AR10]